MKIEQAIAGVKLIFLDTAPVIYYIERHPTFFPLVRPIFESLSDRDFRAVSSPITLAECSIVPYRQGLWLFITWYANRGLLSSNHCY